MNTRTTMPAQHSNLQVGEEVDFHRPPGPKEAPGCVEPATVADVTPTTRGVVALRHLHQLTEVELKNIRSHMFFLS